jgi:hypothetical protein
LTTSASPASRHAANYSVGATQKTLRWSQGTAQGNRYVVPLPLWLQSASPTGAKEAEEPSLDWRLTQGGARLQRACPGLSCFALSALLPLRGDDRPTRHMAVWVKQQEQGKSLGCLH